MGHRILILEDDESLRLVIAKALSRAGFDVRATASADAALDRLARREADLLLADVLLGRDNFLERLDEVARIRPDAPVIIMSAQTTARTAIEAGKAGVFEYLPKPFDLNVMIETVERALQVAPASGSRHVRVEGLGGLIGQSPAMQDAFRAIGRLAARKSPVLVTGPSGSGRALAARVLLAESGIGGPVIEAGPDRMRRDGPHLLEAASAGALILRRADRWDDGVQDWVQEALETTRADAPRLVATAPPDVGKVLRRELLERLAIGRVDLPPVSERGADRALLFAHFLQQDGAGRSLSEEAASFVNAQVWPGEVLELKRIAARLAVQGRRGPVEPGEIRALMAEFAVEDPSGALEAAARAFFGARAAAGSTEISAEAQLAVDRGLIGAALSAEGGTRIEAAKRLGLNRNTLSRRMVSAGLSSDGS